MVTSTIFARLISKPTYKYFIVQLIDCKLPVHQIEPLRHILKILVPTMLKLFKTIQNMNIFTVKFDTLDNIGLKLENYF